MESVPKSKWPLFALLALNTILGLQILKAFLSLLVNFLRERPNISLIEVAIYALATFCAVFLAGFLFKAGPWRTLWILMAVIVLARAVLQVSSWGPLSLAAAAAGTVLWIASFIFFLSVLPSIQAGLLAGAFIAGISIETALHGLYGTWDLIWRRDAVSLALGWGLAAAQLILTSIVADRITPYPFKGKRRTGFYAFIIFMPAVFLQLLKFQNVASINAYSEVGLGWSLAMVLVSNILAYVVIARLMGTRARCLVSIIMAAAIVLSFIPANSAWLYVVQAALGNIACLWLISAAFIKGMGQERQHNLYWPYVASVGLGGLLMAILAFIYYSSYDLVLPFDPWAVALFAALLVAAGGLASAVLPWSGKPVRLAVVPWYLLLILLLVPLMVSGFLNTGTNYHRQKDTVRVMDYNLHQGFNIDGFLDLEAIARVIEGSGAEVVALQEVSRGWVINGGADDLDWLARRLGMDYLFVPASDAVWGNALLSKYPVKLLSSGFLPRLGAPLRRSYLLAEIDTGAVENIRVMVTHIHHIADEGHIREEQVQQVIEGWGGRDRTLIAGDFNAETGDPEIEMMKEAGLVDVQLQLGKQDQLTWVHYPPYRRIDYIWATPDLEASGLEVIYSRASDHLPVAVDVR